MDNYENSDKLDRYLDELSSEYRALLFEELIKRSNSVDKLSVSDLLRLDDEVKKHLRSDYIKVQRKRRILLYLGLSYILFGCFFYIISQLINHDDIIFSTESIMSLLLCFSGLVVSIISAVVPFSTMSKTNSKKSPSEEPSSLVEYDIIKKWREIEGLTNDFAIDQKLTTPKSAIEYLSQNLFIDKAELDVLRSLLRLRNSIIHSADLPCSYANAREIITAADKILSKLRNVLG